MHADAHVCIEKPSVCESLQWTALVGCCATDCRSAGVLTTKDVDRPVRSLENHSATNSSHARISVSKSAGRFSLCSCFLFPIVAAANASKKSQDKRAAAPALLPVSPRAGHSAGLEKAFLARLSTGAIAPRGPRSAHQPCKVVISLPLPPRSRHAANEGADRNLKTAMREQTQPARLKRCNNR